jgi:CDP-diacylglycerol--serine O-phosphatidyltransferase
MSAARKAPAAPAAKRAPAAPAAGAGNAGTPDRGDAEGADGPGGRLGDAAGGRSRRRGETRRRLQRRMRRGAYLLPSLFTIGNILLGFYAIVCGLETEFKKAALLVFVAGILDSLDGRIARMTGTESDFGKEFDSLADIVTFGVTPALLTYLWGVKDLARDAWMVPLFYLVCAATRLARFNVQVKAVDSRYFVGLPAPAAAGAICSLLFFAPEAEWRDWLEVLVASALLLIGVLMVSTFRYHSFKDFDLRRRWSYRAAAPLAAIVLVIVYVPRATFLVIAILYSLSAPVSYLLGRLRARRAPLPPPPPASLSPPPPSSLPPPPSAEPSAP